jgi:hypothetical protein
MLGNTMPNAGWDLDTSYVTHLKGKGKGKGSSGKGHGKHDG